MPTKKVVFVEFPVFSGVVPLASGYMEAFCRKDPELAARCAFEKISLAVTSDYEDVIATLERSDGDVYGFSCYVWNIGLVRRVLNRLWTTRPGAQFILGGPQVIKQGHRYLQPDRENVYVCNGEGEPTFAGFLRSVFSGDIGSVRNLSFYRDGQLMTTDAAPRMTDLSEIPSPFLEGLFEAHRYTWMLIETNRGCPFQCNYCFWGAATGARVYKYDEQRLEREFEWISQSGCSYLFIADANWGMLKRDLDLSKHIVACQKKHGSPMYVNFCGSKNTPDRVAAISEVFHSAGMIGTQSVAMQTMSSEALKRVNRENIKLTAYAQVQQSLNDKGISSFVEMIWPLPGETLTSFRRGLSKLCEKAADSFLVYPLLLMNNVELAEKRDEYGLVTVQDPDPNSEAEIVVETREVTRRDYEQGIRFVYAVTALYTMRGLWYLGRYLSRTGIVTYEQLVCGFIEYAASRPDHSWTRFGEQSIASLDTGNFSNIGELIHLTLHAERDAFDDLLEGFVTQQSWYRDDPVAQCFFEIDAVNRPYVYSNTPIREKHHRCVQLTVETVPGEGFVVDVPAAHAGVVREYLTIDADDGRATRFEVDHGRSQIPLMPVKSSRENFLYCQDMSQRMRDLVPIWSVAEDAELQSVGSDVVYQ